MELIGLRFFMTDGTIDCYDPVDYKKDFTENEYSYEINNGYGKWIIWKNTVKGYERYLLCSGGYELYGNSCHNLNCKYCN